MKTKTERIFPRGENVFQPDGKAPANWEAQAFIDWLKGQMVRCPKGSKMMVRNCEEVAIDVVREMSPEEVDRERMMFLLQDVQRRANAGDEDAKKLLRDFHLMASDPVPTGGGGPPEPL